MSGRLLGRTVKSVLLPMIGLSTLFPDIEARLKAMKDDDWYDWAEYSEMLAKISAKLSPASMVSVGFNVISKLKPRFVEAGYDTLEKVMQDLHSVVSVVSKDLPVSGHLRTIEYTAGRAIVETGTLRPPDVVEGYLKAFVILNGGSPPSIQRTTLKRADDTYYRFLVVWE